MTSDRQPPWIRRDFRRDYRAAERKRRSGHVNPAFCAALGTLEARSGDPLRWYVATPAGLQTGHPYLDARVLRIALAEMIRAPEPSEGQKPLLREAFRPILPAMILDRRAKGHFDELYYAGLNRHRDELVALVRAASGTCGEVFDPNELIAALNEACLAGADALALQRFDSSMALVRWLGSRSKWINAPLPSATEVIESKVGSHSFKP